MRGLGFGFGRILVWGFEWIRVWVWKDFGWVRVWVWKWVLNGLGFGFGRVLEPLEKSQLT